MLDFKGGDVINKRTMNKMMGKIRKVKKFILVQLTCPRKAAMLAGLDRSIGAAHS